MKYLENKNIAVIGTGNMAGAIIGALLRNKELNPEQITASDPQSGTKGTYLGKVWSQCYRG